MRVKCPLKKQEQGFSLFELAIVLLILSFLIYPSAASFMNLAPKYRLEKTVWEIRSNLNLARYKALWKGRPIRLRFDSNYFTLESYDEDKKKWKLEQSHVLEGVTVQANNSPIFYPQGTVSSMATILVSNSWGKYKITIAISGRVKAMKL